MPKSCAFSTYPYEQGCPVLVCTHLLMFTRLRDNPHLPSNCLFTDGDNVELAKIALGRAAVYNGHVQNLSDSHALARDEEVQCKQLKAEWLGQRMMVVSILEHFYSVSYANG